MLKKLFHPPPGLSKKRYLRYSVITVTLLSLTASVAVTLLVELFNPTANYLQGLWVALVVPLLVVPPLALWHHGVLFDLEAAKREIEQLSRTDGLTSLNNRRYFFELSHREAASAERYEYPISVLIIDLDHFKSVNDNYGHQTGDKVLQLVSRVMGRTVRDTDVIGRYGGEEFVALLSHASLGQAQELCQRLRKALAAEQARDGGGLPKVTVSAGVAASPQVGYDLETLLAEADKALYQAKENGRDRCVPSSACTAEPPADLS
jgi:diguanylate cyclase (GGDEF)-like protein